MKRVHIKMTEDGMGHDVDESGVTLPAKHFKKGESYEVHESLAECFHQEKKCVAGSAKMEEQKSEDESPEENPMERGSKGKKNMKGAPENK